MRRVVLAALLVYVPSTLGAAQPTPAAFEVASVKLDPNQEQGPRTLAELSLPIVRVLPGGRIESYGHTLRNLIAWAWDVNTLYQQIQGKQEVLETVLVISARASTPSPTPAEAKQMIQTLLEERFQLRWRLEPRDIDGYVLMPTRDDGQPGPGLRAFTGDCEARDANEAVPFDSPEYEQQARCRWVGRGTRQRAVGVSMRAIAERLALLMATPVSDGTGWPGLFTFDVIAGTDALPLQDLLRRAAGRPAPPPTDAPHLLEVFRRELGVKLVKERVTAQDFVVERAEPLIEN